MAAGTATGHPSLAASGGSCAFFTTMRTRGYRAHRVGINEYLAKKAFGEIAKLCLAVIARSPCDEAIHTSLAALAAPWIASLRSQ